MCTTVKWGFCVQMLTSWYMCTLVSFPMAVLRWQFLCLRKTHLHGLSDGREAESGQERVWSSFNPLNSSRIRSTMDSTMSRGRTGAMGYMCTFVSVFCIHRQRGCRCRHEGHHSSAHYFNRENNIKAYAQLAGPIHYANLE